MGKKRSNAACTHILKDWIYHPLHSAIGFAKGPVCIAGGVRALVISGPCEEGLFCGRVRVRSQAVVSLQGATRTRVVSPLVIYAL